MLLTMNAKEAINFTFDLQENNLSLVIARIRTLPEAEIADMQKEIERQKQKAVAAVERFQRLKKQLIIPRDCG